MFEMVQDYLPGPRSISLVYYTTFTGRPASLRFLTHVINAASWTTAVAEGESIPHVPGRVSVQAPLPHPIGRRPCDE